VVFAIELRPAPFCIDIAVSASCRPALSKCQKKFRPCVPFARVSAFRHEANFRKITEGAFRVLSGRSITPINGRDLGEIGQEPPKKRNTWVTNMSRAAKRSLQWIRPSTRFSRL